MTNDAASTLFDTPTFCDHGRPDGRGCPFCLSVGRAEDERMLRRLDRQESQTRIHAGDEEKTAGLTVAKATGSRYRRMVLAAHYAHQDGLTDDDVARIVDHPDLPSARTAIRRGELVKWGWIEKAPPVDGKKATRLTRTGHPAQVWRLAKDARRLIYTGEAEI